MVVALGAPVDDLLHPGPRHPSCHPDLGVGQAGLDSSPDQAVQPVSSLAGLLLQPVIFAGQHGDLTDQIGGFHHQCQLPSSLVGTSKWLGFLFSASFYTLYAALIRR
jgi:hypothetical protein